MAALVVDCSVTLAWFLGDEGSPLTDGILDRVADAGAIAPALWPLEVGNALLIAERRGRLPGDHRARILRHLADLPIVLDDETAARAWRETSAIAEAQALTLYDAAYLELAARLALPLATLDRPLREAAQRVGVEILPG